MCHYGSCDWGSIGIQLYMHQLSIVLNVLITGDLRGGRRKEGEGGREERGEDAANLIIFSSQKYFVYFFP